MSFILIKELMMTEQESIFQKHLADHGLKLTRTRKLILDMVFELHEHFDAETLYDSIRKVSKDISQATVYRTLPLLLEAGLIQQSLRSAARDQFEHVLGHPRHLHWICKRCGALTETDSKDISPVLTRLAKGLKFQVDDIKIVIEGLCWKCQVTENGSQKHE